MNSRTVSSPLNRGKVSPISPKTILALAFVALLALVAVIVWQAAPSVAPAAQTPSGERFLAQNPELSAAARYDAARYSPTAERFLARNPELSAAARYSAGGAVTEVASGERFLAQNPELSAARRTMELRAND